jgi:hypothetical protein
MFFQLLEFKEIVGLVVLFTILALYFDIHGEKHVLGFVIDHVIALLLALLISKVIYNAIRWRSH